MDEGRWDGGANDAIRPAAPSVHHRAVLYYSVCWYLTFSTCTCPDILQSIFPYHLTVSLTRHLALVLLYTDSECLYSSSSRSSQLQARGSLGAVCSGNSPTHFSQLRTNQIRITTGAFFVPSSPGDGLGSYGGAVNNSSPGSVQSSWSDCPGSLSMMERIMNRGVPSTEFQIFFLYILLTASGTMNSARWLGSSHRNPVPFLFREP